MTPPIRILLAEDQLPDAELALRELKRAGLRVDHRLTDTESGFRSALVEFEPQVILSDFSMPQFDGMFALEIARELRPEVPFIFVSGTIGEEYAIRALKNGATDYVLKTNLVRLPAAVERALHDAQDRRARRKAEKKLAETRERLESIYNSLPDMLWSVELPDERIAYVSPAAAGIFGYPADAFLANKDLWIEVVHEGDRAAVEAAWRRLLADGTAFDIEYRAVKADGSIAWVHDRGRVIRDAEGKALRIDGVARDISEAVRQRERVARLARIRDLLGAANAAFMRIRERRALFEEFCRIAVSRGGLLVARIVELDADGRLSVAASTEGVGAALQSVLDEYNIDAEGAPSLLAQALRSGMPAVSNDLARDPRVQLRPDLGQGEVSSAVILPVRVDGTVVGAALLRARGAAAFDQEEMAILGEMISNLEFALELVARQERLDYLALYDPLTDLPNRTLFRDRLTQAIESSRRAGKMLALTVFDVERFKGINDTYGSSVGDALLRELAARLRRTVGDVNRVARLGGDLFAIMRPDLGDAAEAARVLGDKTASVIGEPFRLDELELKVSAKAGIALFPDDGMDADALFRNAEASLKRAKETGARFLFYSPDINARVAEKVDIEGRLRRAIERRELFLHFQPKVDLVTNRVLGLEALMRWQDVAGRLVPPGQFVPVLEDTGMILEAGRIALELAAEARREWRAAGLRPPRVAVNVSTLQLQQAGFVEDVMRAVGGFEGGVDLEITESLLMQDVEASIAKLKALRQAGLGIALDDFGTGHSSLAYLSRLPIDTLKIDRSFISGMTEAAETTSIVTTIISLAQSLQLKVVAEGVETEEQARLLRLLRCDQMQGYLFSKPLPAAEIATLLAAQPPG